LLPTQNHVFYKICVVCGRWFADATTLRKFRDALGEVEYVRLELKMRGRVCGHVYRVSDLPNRHGFHASHPNPNLGVRWG
jgi:hypothetical protein